MIRTQTPECDDEACTKGGGEGGVKQPQQGIHPKRTLFFFKAAVGRINANALNLQEPTKYDFRHQNDSSMTYFPAVVRSTKLLCFKQVFSRGLNHVQTSDNSQVFTCTPWQLHLCVGNGLLK